MQTRFRAAWVFKRLGADNAPGPLVCDAQHDGAAALVGQRNAVPEQLFKVVTLLGLLEFEALAFGLKQPLLELVQGGGHGDWLDGSELPRKRPLLQRGKQRVERGQRAAVGGFEGFDGLDAGGEGLLEGERGKRNIQASQNCEVDVFLR